MREHEQVPPRCKEELQKRYVAFIGRRGEELGVGGGVIEEAQALFRDWWTADGVMNPENRGTGAAAAALYLAGQEWGIGLYQSRICEVVAVSEPTLRKRRDELDDVISLRGKPL